MARIRALGLPVSGRLGRDRPARAVGILWQGKCDGLRRTMGPGFPGSSAACPSSLRVSSPRTRASSHPTRLRKYGARTDGEPRGLESQVPERMERANA